MNSPPSLPLLPPPPPHTHAPQGERYVTPAGDLAFSVLVFVLVGGAGMAILAVARHYGGELGGSKARQWAIASVLGGLWILYLILSGLRAYDNIANIA